MPRRPQRRPHLRGHVGQVLEAALTTGVNPFAQFTRIITKPSSTKTVKTDEDIPASWKRKRDTPVMAPSVKKLKAALSNLPSSTQDKMDGKGSGKDQGLTETPVDDPFNVQRGPPDYSFCTLPFIQDVTVSSDRWMRQHTFRMTSPYDVVVEESGTADYNSGTGTTNIADHFTDAADSTAVKARWFDFYASMYKYYHVIACRWHITFENQMTEPLWVHEYYGNATERPRLANNQDMLLWADTKSHYVGPVANAILVGGYAERNELPSVENDDMNANTGGTAANYETSNHVAPRGPSNILQISGEYRPGDFDREIHTDNLVENWSLVTSNPALTERLNIRVRPHRDTVNPAAGNTSDYGRILTYRLFTRIEYLVEFKELKDGLKFPVSKQPATLTVVTESRG